MSQLKSIEELNEMNVDELSTYEHELYLLWQQACKITAYRKTMASDRLLLNATNVIDIDHQLTNGEEE